MFFYSVVVNGTGRWVKRQQPKDQTQQLISKLEAQIDNVVSAIAAGAYSQALQAALEKAAQEKRQLLKHLTAKNSRNSTPDIVSYSLRYRQLIKQIEAQKLDIVEAQKALRELLGEKTPLHPMSEGYLEAEISGGL